MSVRRWTTAGLMALAVLVISTAQAQASLGEFSFAGSFKFGQIDEGIAIDESTDNVYVYDSGGIIAKFDADGNPVDFSSLGSNTISGVGSYGGGETELAVDNSASPAKGDIYLAGGSGVQIYGADGTKLGELTEIGGRPWGEVACGVSVDGAGNVYVGLYPSYISEYTPTANPVTNNDYTASHGGLNEICEIAAAPNGVVYASTWDPSRESPIVKLDSVQSAGAKQVVAKAGGTLSVANSPSAELFFGLKNQFIQFDSLGNQIGTFGAGEFRAYHALAVNAKNGRIYAFNADTNNAEPRTVEIWQGVIRPQVGTSPPTALDSSGSATLNGFVNPEGVSIESCSFEYGQSASYGSASPCSQATPLTGKSLLNVSAQVSGLTPNHAYHYRLSTADEHGTIDGGDETFTILVLPTVDDQAPSVSAITRDSAKLTGTINPEHAETRYHFDYGTTEGYGNVTPFRQIADGIGTDTTVGLQLSDLLPNTTYHYRVVASNVAGTVAGADHTFTTGERTPPSATTGGSGGITQNGAGITGSVDTNGLPTSYGFEIGTSTDYGPPTGLGYVGAGSSNAPVSLSLTGLQPGTTYHYRLTATNVDGTSYGEDQTFTTTVFANTFAEPPAPLPFVTVPALAFPAEPKGSVVKKKSKSKGKKVKRHHKAKNKKPKHKKK